MFTIRFRTVVYRPDMQVTLRNAVDGIWRPPVMPRRGAKRQPVNVKTLAQGLPDSAFHEISWREGMNERLRGRFAAVRVRCAGGCVFRGIVTGDFAEA